MVGSESQNAVLTLKDVSVSYGSSVAVESVSLIAPAKKIMAWIGPSGCGKSSLLSAINRMSDMTPSCRVTGSIRFHDQEVLDRDADLIELRKRIGMIFQKPNPFPLSIRKNIELPLKEHGVRNKSELADRVEFNLKEAGIWSEVKDRLSAPALSLSGGQQQRLCIARALSLKPEVILMDEPCSSLDPISSGCVEDLILKLKASSTIVLVSHDIGQAKRVADQIAVFWYENGTGRIVETCQDRDSFETSQHPITRCFIDGNRC